MLKKISAIYQRFSKRERVIFWLTAAIVGFFLSDRAVLGPALDRISQLDRQAREEETAIRKSMHVLLRKDQISQENKQFEVFSVDAKSPEEEVIGLLKELENIANKSSVNLLYVKPGSIEDKSGAKKFYASLECEAEMQEVAGFFYSIESSTKLLKIEKYEIQPKTRDSSIARCVMTISKTVLAKT